MEIKTISDKYKSYLKKVLREPNESVSQYYFYGDNVNKGINQCIYYTKHVYDSIFGEDDLMRICKNLSENGWGNIVIERYKNYYVKARIHPARVLKSMIVTKYKYVEL